MFYCQVASSFLSPPLDKPLSWLPGTQNGIETGAPNKLTSPLNAGGIIPQYKGKYKEQTRAWKRKASSLLSAHLLSCSKEDMNASVLENHLPLSAEGTLAAWRLQVGCPLI